MEKVKVLLIEDDEDDYIITRDLLYEIDPDRFALTWAASYDAALEKIVENGYDICLLDYRLGTHDGLALLRQARSMDFDAPVILLTGQPEELAGLGPGVGAQRRVDAVPGDQQEPGVLQRPVDLVGHGGAVSG